MIAAIKIWWNEFWQTAVNNPKTTLSGLLSFVAITSTVLLTFQFQPKTMAGLAIVSALAKAYVAAISKDSGQQLAKVPGIAAPMMVPSHEVPDASAAGVKAVKN